MLTAARDLFGEQGFNGTTTREIAERAGVDEVLLFRNFGSKDELFQHAVGRPIAQFLRDYTDRWMTASYGDADPTDILRSFVESLYDLCQQNRNLLLAATPRHLGNGAQTPLSLLERMADETKRIYGFDFNAHIAVRAAVAMVITVSIFDTPLFGPNPHATREEIIDELTGILVAGLTKRDASASTSSPADPP